MKPIYSLPSQVMKTHLMHILFFGDISKVCLQFVWQLDVMWVGGAHCCLYWFPQACCLARCLPGSSMPVGQTDDDDDCLWGCSSPPPMFPTVAVRGAGAEDEEQRGDWEERLVKGRLVEGNKRALLYTCCLYSSIHSISSCKSTEYYMNKYSD